MSVMKARDKSMTIIHCCQPPLSMAVLHRLLRPEAGLLLQGAPPR